MFHFNMHFLNHRILKIQLFSCRRSVNILKTLPRDLMLPQSRTQQLWDKVQTSCPGPHDPSQPDLTHRTRWAQSSYPSSPFALRVLLLEVTIILPTGICFSFLCCYISALACSCLLLFPPYDHYLSACLPCHAFLLESLWPVPQESRGSL